MQKQLLVASLTLMCVGGGLYAFIYPYLTGEIKGQRRQSALLTGTSGRQASRGVDQAKRRKAITESLSEIEGRRRKGVDLKGKIEQAGLEISKTSYFIISAVLGLALGVAVYLASSNELAAAGAVGVGGLGLPRWGLNYLQKRRIKKFVQEFPGAIDVIVRGVKAGLPLGDCFRIVATETAEPVKGEFVKIIEAQAIGMTMPEAVDRFALRVPVSEVAFFSIVLNLQQKAGGNLSETLANLSGVLRDRKKMKEKVKAISAEAKASAGIIGSLPFIVGGVVYLSNPEYIMLLFNTTRGNIVLGGSLFWMSIGVFIMYQMINFEI
jgi:tight adherence protein B